MSTDAGSRLQPRRPFPLDLPKIVRLRIRRVRVEPPALTYFRSALSDAREAIEFLVDTDGEVPVRAYGPALFVGDVEVSHSERIDRTRWRFLAFDTERLKDGAPIRWGWMKDREEDRQQTEYRFEVKGEASAGD